jgi:hypothetical protein
VLALAGGEPALGATLDLKLASPQDTQAVAFLGVSGALALDGLGCGLALPGIGELMLGLQPGPLLLPAGKFLGASSLVTSAPLPADVSFVGLSLHLQGLLLAPFVPLEPVRLTSALSVTIGL